MRRIHLFEFEDFPWFPGWLRECLTRYIVAIHDLVGTPEKLSPVVDEVLTASGHSRIVDLCSGAGGPMIDVVERLRAGGREVELVLTDLYPNTEAAARVERDHEQMHYVTESVDASDPGRVADNAVRSICCALHHMPPDVAKKILKSAHDDKAPFVAFELSDNSAPPIPLWWIGLLPTFIFSFFVSLKVRPMTFNQFFFTYVIPLVPLFVAWDGTVSNVRTYSESDLGELTADLQDGYSWEVRRLKNRTPADMLVLVGQPA